MLEGVAVSHRIGTVGAVLVALLFGGNVWAAGEGGERSVYAFQDGMHRIFHAFTHIRISLEQNRRDVTDILLRDAEAAIATLPEHLPKYRADNTPTDREGLLQRLETLKGSIGTLRAALREGREQAVKALPGDIFNQCVHCHKQARLAYLFRAPPGAGNAFQDYMHRVSNQFAALSDTIHTGGPADKARDHLTLIGYYLELLKAVLPAAGPSGVILDRGRDLERIGALQRIAWAMHKATDAQRANQVEFFRQTINGFCVSCHGPERLGRAGP